MGKVSRRKNRLAKSKAERKINRDIATKNHAYNFATCKSTGKIKRMRADMEHLDDAKYFKNNPTWQGIALEMVRNTREDASKSKILRIGSKVEFKDRIGIVVL